MAIDRNHRDVVADNLAAFLRGDLDRKLISEKLLSIQTERKDQTIHDEYLDELLEMMPFVFLRLSDLPETWDYCNRHLAFLKSDLDVRTPPQSPRGREPHVLFLRGHLLILAAALGISLFFGWWTFGIVWLVSGTVGMILVQVQGRADDFERRQLTRFWPFLNEAEWLGHRNHVEAYQLPSYDEWRQKNRIATSWFQPAVSAGFWLLIVCMATYMFAFSVVVWPLWVLLMVIAEFFQHKNREEAAP